MPFTALVQSLKNTPFLEETAQRLQKSSPVRLQGANRVAKGLTSSALARKLGTSLLVVCGTLEEAARWSAQLEAMGWEGIYLYPSSEATPYEPFDPEEEITWGQLNVLAELVDPRPGIAIVCTSRALQPHLPPPEALACYCLTLQPGSPYTIERLSDELVRLGYARTSQVESEGQFSRRGDILDCFAVSAEMPVRIEWFGDELEKIREFDPTSQRSLDAVSETVFTPVGFGPVIVPELEHRITPQMVAELPPAWQTAYQTQIEQGQAPEGLRRWLGFAYDQPASLIDYLPPDVLVVFDEPELCRLHSQRWYEQAQEQWEHGVGPIPLHTEYSVLEERLTDFARLELRELVEEGKSGNLGGRPVPSIPHQFGPLAERLREYRTQGLQVWMVSAQPSRVVALLGDHDCPSQFIPNSQDFQALDKAQATRTPVALKYSGLAELEGSVLGTLRFVLVTDREFFGQHALTTPNFVRKRRRATSRQLDPDKLNPGDYVVHRNHGVGRFAKLEKLAISGNAREYLVIEYADGILRVAADQMNALSRYRTMGEGTVQLSRMTGKSWEKARQKVKKSVQKIAFDLLELYARRAREKTRPFPPDWPWQREVEDSFPYPLTPDQAKAVQEVKFDLESERPMDRLVCGDVGFGKTEVALRAVFKVLTSGRQAAILVPTTVLAQQHYHTFKERFAPYPISVGLLNRFRTFNEKKDLLARLKTGELDLVVGTHQLLGGGIDFKDLGLLVIDEEQRFGVAQKEKIKLLKTKVDVLTLTATPIPRTLYMALSGVREMSLITTPPPGRRAIKTHLAPYDPEHARTALLQELNRGGQVFYVHNRVEDIAEVAERVRQMVPSARIAVGHGQMDEGELESTMLAFAGGEYDILVCTTIVESGLDIPRVNTILIENAQNFGLSQLYQLRGRVGRSGVQAHAWLFYKQEEALTEAARKRLRAIQEFTQLGSGYQLSMRDMEIRGVGNLLGAEQSGQMNAVGFDLYMELLDEAIQEIRGRTLPKVEDTQIDLGVTAFIPADYIPDLEQKMRAYRQVAVSANRTELAQITTEWTERFGPLPSAAQQLLRVMDLKQVARVLGFSRIKPEGTNIALETTMEAPAWEQLSQSLPADGKGRFIYQPGRVIVRGLGALGSAQQMETLIRWLDKIQVPQLEAVS